MMVNLYSYLDETFMEFDSKKELEDYVIENYNDSLTHLEIIHEYQNIYALYDTQEQEYL